jgi:hypothetical protein
VSSGFTMPQSYHARLRRVSASVPRQQIDASVPGICL